MWFTLLLYPLNTICFHFLFYFYWKFLPFHPGFILLGGDFSLIMTFNLSEASSKTPEDQISLFFVSSCEFSPAEWSICSLWLQTLVCYPLLLSNAFPPPSIGQSPPSLREHSMVTQLHSSAPIVFWTGILSPLSFAHSTPPPGHLLAWVHLDLFLPYPPSALTACRGLSSSLNKIPLSRPFVHAHL